MLDTVVARGRAASVEVVPAADFALSGFAATKSTKKGRVSAKT